MEGSKEQEAAIHPRAPQLAERSCLLSSAQMAAFCELVGTTPRACPMLGACSFVPIANAERWNTTTTLVEG